MDQRRRRSKRCGAFSAYRRTKRPRAYWPTPALRESSIWPACARATATLAHGSAAECRRAAIIDAWLDADPATKAQTFERYAAVFLTKEGQTREGKALATRKVECASPGTLQVLRTEANRLACVLPRHRAAVTAEASEALLMLGQVLMLRYRELKDRRAQLDYSDLIETAARLLHGDGGASWVLYKLDGGIDHVLIDEAQDTAPEQWEVIKKLTEEFFSGEGARRARRTIFAVGDVKQSIFSFQGADPAAFLASRDWYGDRVPGAGHDWRPIPLKTSFRSTRAVLTAVDATFRDAEMARSIALEPEEIVHQAYRLRDGGSVEVWPPIAARPPEKSDPWAPPTERVGTDSPQIRLARLIAARIQAMLDRKRIAGVEGSADRARRCHGAGTAPHAVHASAGPRTEGAAAPRRRRRPDASHRAARGDGLDGAGQVRAAPGGRSDARDGAEGTGRGPR